MLGHKGHDTVDWTALAAVRASQLKSQMVGPDASNDAVIVKRVLDLLYSGLAERIALHDFQRAAAPSW